MQKIERYGVIALVFLLVTILAVSLWGESKGGWFNWNKDKKVVAAAPNAVTKLPPLEGSGATDPSNPNGIALSATPGVLGSGGGATAPVVDANKPIVGGNGALPTPWNTNVAPLGTQPAPQPLRPLFTDATVVNGGAIAQPIDGAHPIVRPSPLFVDAAPALTSTTREYTVKSGDTLGGIASHELGSAQRWEEIAKLNGDLNPSKLKVGMTLKLPAGAKTTSVAKNDAKSETVKAKPASGRSYTVKSGDTLSRIALHELGDADQWNDIAALNPGIDANRLKVGAKLALPAGAVAKKNDEPRAERIAYGTAPVGKKSRVQ